MTKLPFADVLFFVRVLANSSVILRKPPPMDTTGKPIVPPPEKSFLAKNWTYIMAGVLILSELDRRSKRYTALQAR